MNCKYCNNQLQDSTKFCNECGKSTEVEKLKVDVLKIRKGLKRTGNLIHILGWLTIIINGSIYLWSVIDKNFAESGLRGYSLSGIFFIVVISSVFVILGNRIKGLVDKNMKLYLQILLGLSILVLVVILSTGGRIGILFLFAIVYIISSLASIRKAMKVSEFKSTLISPKYKLNKNVWILFSVISIILFFIFSSVDLSRQENAYYPIKETGDTYTTEELVTEMVKEVKTQIGPLPAKIDEVTTLVDITAEPSAIRYHYIFSNIDTSKLSNIYLKNSISQNICQDVDIKNLLSKNIDIEYSYRTDSGESYFVSFTRNDCLK